MSEPLQTLQDPGQPATPSPSSRRVFGRLSPLALLVMGLATLHLAFSLSVNPPGYLTWDSGTYHYMAKTFAETGSFVVWNGYEEYPSPELVVGQLKVHDGRLVAQYPELMSVLVYPLYVLFGYHGLLLFEALAFLVVNALLFRLATRLFGERRIGYLAMFVYSLGTFAWEYSQSSYPHLASTACLLAAWVLLIETLPMAGNMGRPRRVAWCLGSGCLAGMAIGLRLDAVFGAAGLFVPLLFLRPLRWREGLALGSGFLPALLFLAWTNQIKFGVFSPFDYGHRGRAFYTAGVDFYLPIAAFAGALVVGLASWFRSPPHWRRRSLLALAGAALVLTAVFPSAVTKVVTQLADGAYQIVVDLRIRSLDIQEQGLGRSAGRAMVYMGGVKKSLLQSCPYLVLLLFPLIDAVRRRRENPAELTRLALLLPVPLAFVGVYSYLAWHGSVALNMRYLNPALPFLALLTAYWLDKQREYLSPRLAVVVFVSLFGLLWLHFTTYRFAMFEQELWFLTAPLGIALLLSVLELVRRSRWLPRLGGPLVAYGLVASLAWSGAVAFGRDYMASARVRSNNLVVADMLADFLHDDLLLATDYPDICWDLIDRFDRLRIAFPPEDDWASFEGLATYHLAAGRDVLMATSSTGAELAMRRGMLAPFEVGLVHSWQTGGRPSLMLLALRLPGTENPQRQDTATR